MKKYIFFFFIVLFSLGSSKSFSLNIDEKAFLLEKYLSELNEFSLLFMQKSFDGSTKKGWMLIKKPYNIRIEYEDPHPLIVLSNKNYFILYNAKDNLITHLPVSEGPWILFTQNNFILSANENNKDAHGVVKNIKEIMKDGEIHYFYEILLRNKNKGFMKEKVIVHTSESPIKINGWTIIDGKNNKMHVNISIINHNPNELIQEDIFKLLEKDRESGDVWEGPFNRLPAKRYPQGRF